MDFSSGKKPTALDVEITAEFALDGSVIEIDGLLSGASLDLSATWPSFDITDLDFIHNLLHNAHINIPDFDIAIGSAVISISSSLPSLSFFDVVVDGRFTLPSVSMDFSSLLGPNLMISPGQGLMGAYGALPNLMQSVYSDPRLLMSAQPPASQMQRGPARPSQRSQDPDFDLEAERPSKKGGKTKDPSTGGRDKWTEREEVWVSQADIYHLSLRCT